MKIQDTTYYALLALALTAFTMSRHTVCKAIHFINPIQFINDHYYELNSLGDASYFIFTFAYYGAVLFLGFQYLQWRRSNSDH